MADETNKEILEEMGEGVTEGTQTEGTTGNGYLTKPYLVRNLQTFWGKIKQYITNSVSDFVNQDTVNGAIALAVSDRAAKEDLTSLETEVNSLADTVATKADQDDLTAVENALKNKVEKVNGMGLSTNDFTNDYKDKLDNLKNATETEDGLMSFSDKEKLEGIEIGATKTVVETTIESGTNNPVTCRAIKAALANKVDKEDPETLEDPSSLLTDGDLQGSATEEEGHIVLKFKQKVKNLKIHISNNDSSNPIDKSVEKICVMKNDQVIFTNFQEVNDLVCAIIENPEGKTTEGSWAINPGASFSFYIECLELINGTKYKPFILAIKRSNPTDLTKISLVFIQIY